MKNLLITGASGFIGRNLSEHFASTKTYRLFLPTSRDLNLTDKTGVGDYLRKNSITHIIHAANIGGARNKAESKDVVDINLRMFFNLVLHEHSFERMIYFCSGAAYDKSKPIEDAVEEDVLQELPSDGYGFYKNVLARYLSLRQDRKIIALRLFGVYGKYEDHSIRFISNAITNNLHGKPITIGQNVVFDYLFVQDLFQVVGLALEKDLTYNTYNVTKGEKIDLLTLASLVNQVADKKSPVKLFKPGLNFEYTGSNLRLLKELDPHIRFTPHLTAIRNLYAWYKENLPKA